jgi:hypothetical protein
MLPAHFPQHSLNLHGLASGRPAIVECRALQRVIPSARIASITAEVGGCGLPASPAGAFCRRSSVFFEFSTMPPTFDAPRLGRAELSWCLRSSPAALVIELRYKPVTRMLRRIPALAVGDRRPYHPHPGYVISHPALAEAVRRETAMYLSLAEAGHPGFNFGRGREKPTAP